MTALLEFKQKIKGLFAQYEVYMMPFFKFVLALVYFVWINSNMGYMRALDNIFVVLILALICSVLPTGMIVFTGCVMMTVHCYALGNRGCRIYAGDPAFYADPVFEIQCRKKHCYGIYATGMCV